MTSAAGDMNRTQLLIVLWILLGSLGLSCERPSPEDKTSATPPPGDSKFREIHSIPDGIRVSHSPNPVRAVRDVQHRYTFTWKYRTAVSSPADDVRITEFGCFTWDGSRWVFSNYTAKPFTKSDFAEWYSCPDGVLQPRESYEDPQNWGGSSALQTIRSLWYFVGTRADGTKVKGTAEVQYLGELGFP